MKVFKEFKKELPPYLPKEDAIETTWQAALEWVLKVGEETCGGSWLDEIQPTIEEELII